MAIRSLEYLEYLNTLRKLTQNGCVFRVHNAGSSYAQIGKAMPGHHIFVKEISAIDDDGITKDVMEAIQIKIGKFLPVSQYQQSICVLRCLISVVRIAERPRRRQYLLSSFHRGRIVCGDNAAFFEELTDQLNRR